MASNASQCVCVRVCACAHRLSGEGHGAERRLANWTRSRGSAAAELTPPLNSAETGGLNTKRTRGAVAIWGRAICTSDSPTPEERGRGRTKRRETGVSEDKW